MGSNCVNGERCESCSEQLCFAACGSFRPQSPRTRRRLPVLPSHQLAIIALLFIVPSVPNPRRNRDVTRRNLPWPCFEEERGGISVLFVHNTGRRKATSATPVLPFKHATHSFDPGEERRDDQESKICKIGSGKHPLHSPTLPCPQSKQKLSQEADFVEGACISCWQPKKRISM